MPKSFPSYTHAIIRTVPDKKDMDLMNGIMAFVDLCFGPGDAHAIRYISIKKMGGPTAGITSHVPKTPIIKEGKKIYTDAIIGDPAAEARMLAVLAFDKVKQVYGMKFNKTYRVLANMDVEELGVTNAVSSNG